MYANIFFYNIRYFSLIATYVFKFINKVKLLILLHKIRIQFIFESFVFVI